MTRLLLRPLRIRPAGKQASPADTLALFEQGPGSEAALVFVLGLADDGVGRAVAETKALRASFQRVVYVTDNPDFTALRREGCIIEYIPSRAFQVGHAPDAPWSSFLADRRDLLIAKWEPSVLLSLGTPWHEWLAGIRTDEAARASQRAGACDPAPPAGAALAPA